MKKIFLFIAFAAISIPAFSQKAKKANKSQPTPPPPIAVQKEDPGARMALDQQRMMGPLHHILIQSSGHWREEMKIWPSSGLGEPMTSRLERDGMIKAEGRFLAYDTRGTISGAQYEGNCVLGYDNGKRKFVKTWFDNMGTGILVLEGDYDEKTQKVDFNGTTMDPLTREMVKVHQVWNISSPEKQVLEIYSQSKEGKKIKTMEIISSRG